MKKVVFISGASSGIGAGLVEKFRSEGFLVAAIARREMAARENVLALRCDVGDKHSVREAVLRTEKELGPIDILVANAGVGFPSPGDPLDAEIFEKTFRVNVFGAIYCFEAVIPAMIRRKKGQLVSISSLASFRGLPQAGAYSSSKAALSALTESLRLDLKKHGISVSLICPGYIKTPLTERNRYPMPFILETEKGVEEIFTAIRKKKKIYAFPRPLSTVVKSFRFWPAWAYDAVMAGRKNLKN